MSNLTDIYQTLEDRGNYDEIECHGPYYCSLYDSNGRLKNGTQEPWLGEGYYFWDTRIEDAIWWGRTIYNAHYKGYVVCSTCYDQHSPLLFDMMGSIALCEEFGLCAKIVRENCSIKKVTFPLVLEYMKKQDRFTYKAIRVMPYPEKQNLKNCILFPGKKAKFEFPNKIQICFFDKTLLNQPFVIAEKHPFEKEFVV